VLVVTEVLLAELMVVDDSCCLEYFLFVPLKEQNNSCSLVRLSK